MRALLPTLLATLTLLPLVPTAAADAHGDCDGKGMPALGVLQFGDGSPGTSYLDDRGYVFGNGLWLYYESNGASGLQRGGSALFVPDDNEICYDDSDVGPDTLIW